MRISDWSSDVCSSDLTENSHEDTEYPNLRDEVTAIRLIAEETAKTSAETAAVVNTLASSVADDRRASRTETEGVRADVRTLSGRLDLHIATAATHRSVAPLHKPTFAAHRVGKKWGSTVKLR